MKRRIALVIGLLASLFVLPIAPTAMPVSAIQGGVYIYNTPLTSNKGLSFCTPETVKGCIESVSVGGVQLTQVQSQSQAQYQIGGGVYSLPCRFEDTTVSQCEVPFMVLVTLGGNPNIPLQNATINFRRQTLDHPTSSIGAVVVNGSLQSFTPTLPGVRDVASITANAAEVHTASDGYCVGWAVEIDNCTIGDVGRYKTLNRLSMLLLPAMRSSVVPPDAVDQTCKANDPSSKCFVTIFDELSRGGWTDTDASVFGLASTDRFTGAAQLKIAGPHYKTPVNGVSDLNLSYFRMFLPSAHLDNAFGLTPAAANAQTLPVRRTTGTGSTVPVTEYIPSASGLLISSTGIGFSIPTMSVQRVLVVKRNQKITATSIFKAAGVHQALKFGKATISINKKNGMSYASKRYRFSKVKTLTVTIKYRSTKLAISERKLTVTVTK